VRSGGKARQGRVRAQDNGDVRERRGGSVRRDGDTGTEHKELDSRKGSAPRDGADVP